MRKRLILGTVVALLVMLAAGCAPEGTQAPIMPAPGQDTPAPTGEPASTPTPTTTPAGEEGNFRLLISDEANAIGDFEQLHVTISQLGVKQADESSEWAEYDLDPTADPDGDGTPGVDLTKLQGENATGIWTGYVEPGDYVKVFIYVDNVTGILNGNGGEVGVKLPSGKLQISKPFTLGSDLIVNFVFDITVVKAGESGKYILKPQIDPSGPNKPFNLVTAKGKPEGTGKPEDKGKPESVGKPENKGKPEDAGKPEEPGPEGAESEDDTTPPVISVSGVVDNEEYAGPVTPVVEVSDETDVEPSVTVTLNGEAYVSGTELSEVGEYELEVVATDASGNEAEITVRFNIVPSE